jgi:hypothetical protein
VSGIKFDVDFHNIWHNSRRLNASRVGYRVKDKSVASGGRQLSSIWRYGVELEYTSTDGKVKTLFLCKACHEDRNNRNAVFIVDGTAHIRKHIERVHHINVDTGETILGDTPTDPFTAALSAPRIAGSSSSPSHLPWEEEKLQEALADWVIMRDLSFSDAVAPETRGVVTWNRLALLHALPNSVGTISNFIKKRLEARISEVSRLLDSAQSKISLSFDIWTSNNHYSFLSVIAHFVGKSLIYENY